MITVIVKYTTSKSYTQEEITGMLRFGAEKMFQGMPHLHNKQFCFDVETSEGVSVYLWDSRKNAEAFFNDAFLEQFQQSMGTVPSIEFYSTILAVDNRQGDIMMDD